ncbi:MAG TPA: MFS transporter [Ktedonobacterales bacterium]
MRISTSESEPKDTLAQEGALPTRPTPLWHNRDYLLLWGGQIVSSVGSRVSLVALPLLLVFLTHSLAQAGLVAALQGVPYVLLTLPAGALIDRWDRRRVMIVCDAARAVALGSVPLAAALGRLSLAQLCLVALADGIMEVFFGLAEVSALPRVVPNEQLAAAGAQSQVTGSLSWLLGPALGGVLFGITPGLPSLADSLSYLCSVLTLLGIRTRLQGERTAAPMTARGLWDEVRAGLRWLWRAPALRFVAVLTGVLMICAAGYTLLVIAIGQHLHASDAQIGLVLGAGGVGGLVGALVAGPLMRRFGFRRVLLWSAWAWALTWPPFAFAPNMLTLGVILAASFVCVPIYQATQFSYRMMSIPDELQGRVSGVFRLIAFGSAPLGLALTGLLLERWGAVVAVLVTFAPQLLVVLIATWHRGLKVEEAK